MTSVGARRPPRGPSAARPVLARPSREAHARVGRRGQRPLTCASHSLIGGTSGAASKWRVTSDGVVCGIVWGTVPRSLTPDARADRRLFDDSFTMEPRAGPVSVAGPTVPPRHAGRNC